jgi:hypothetical protein
LIGPTQAAKIALVTAFWTAAIGDFRSRPTKRQGLAFEIGMQRKQKVSKGRKFPGDERMD